MELNQEQLSALVDDELEQVGPAISRLLAADGAADRQRWARYHLIGELLRDGGSEAEAAGLGARISEAIAAAPPLIAAPKPAKAPAQRWLRPAHALAASLAAVGVFGVSQVVSLHRGASEFPLAQTGNNYEGEQADTLGVSASERAEQRRRLNSYIVNFNEQRDSLTLPKLHPYVRIVGFHNEGKP